MKVTDLKVRQVERQIGKDGFEAGLVAKFGDDMVQFRVILAPEELTEFNHLAERIIARLNTDDGEGR